MKKKEIFEALGKIIDEKLTLLKEGESSTEEVQEEKIEDLRSRDVGDIVTIDFENVTIKMEKFSDNRHDLFIIIDANESKQLKNGDIIKFVKKQGDVEPPLILKKGKELKFEIFRKISVDYQSNAIVSWY